MDKEAYAVPNPLVSGKTIQIDFDKCVGCNKCIEACRRDVFAPNPDQGKPLVLYPDECWYCGCCVMECQFGAIHLIYPLYQRISVIWKERENEEFFYLRNNFKKEEEKCTKNG
jgi:NAD-dependent dihydropyrimidine dehydrogenase PreA subunit